MHLSTMDGSIDNSNDSLCLEEISVELNKRRILCDISCEFPTGEWTHIVGANGAGKSTLLKAIAGILPPCAGHVVYRGADIWGLLPHERARIMAYVPQRIEALPPIRAASFVAQGLYAHRLAMQAPTTSDIDRAMSCMASMKLEHLANRSIDEVSGGERQMLVLCSAILQDAQMILLDEPTSALDIHHCRRFFEEIDRLRLQGKTIISVSHDLRQTATYAYNTLVLCNGRCIEFARNRFPSHHSLDETFSGISADDWEEIERRVAKRSAISRGAVSGSVEDSASGAVSGLAKGWASNDEFVADWRSDLRRREVRAMWIVYGALALLIAVLPWVGATWLGIPFDGVAEHIFVNLRIPRVLFAALAGGVLAAVGASFQALFQNPLASPYTLGIASGASLGAMIAIQWGVVSIFALPLLATLGGGVSLIAVIAISHRFGMRSPLYCLLAGVATSMFCSACGLAVQAFATPLTAQQMMRWQLGGLEIAGYDAFYIAPIIAVAIAVLWRNAAPLDLIAVDSELAQSRGVDVSRVRYFVVVAASVAAALVVSQCGPISFVGLVVPNLIRSIYRCDMRTTYALSIPIGAIALLVADAISRIIEGTAWIPVGVIIALIGVPVFVGLMYRKRTI